VYIKPVQFTFRTESGITEVSKDGGFEYLNGVHVAVVGYRVQVFDSGGDVIASVLIHLSARELVNIIGLCARGLIARFVFFWR
jgi:hypothetical protein